MTTTHTQGCLAPCWWRGPVSSPTPRPVPVRCTEGFRHIAVEGGESPNHCGVETPGLRTLGLLLPGSATLPTSRRHKHALRTYTGFQRSCNHASSGQPGPARLTYKRNRELDSNMRTYNLQQSRGWLPTQPRETQYIRTYSLQRSRGWLPTPRSPVHTDQQLARHTETRHSDQQLAKKPRVAAHTPAGVEVRDFIANIHSVQA